MLKVRINNAKFYAYHGVLEHEKEYGNLFEADVEMDCGDHSPGMSDKLGNTVDYLSVYRMVQKIFSSSKYNLIETLTEEICDTILKEYAIVNSVKVCLRKPNAPLGVIDSVEIINQKYRS